MDLHCLFHHGMVDNTNKYGSAGEFFGFFCSLHMVDDTKSCMGDSLVWGSLRLAPITSSDKLNKNTLGVK